LLLFNVGIDMFDQEWEEEYTPYEDQSVEQAKDEYDPISTEWKEEPWLI